jgi:pyruvate-formate lyase-activating enzyme
MATLSQRGEIRLGFRCNARCGFCYYQDLLDNPVHKEPTTAEIRRRLAVLRREGATEVEFTGGEPTIRPDLPNLAAYARELGFTNVSFISNGLRLSNFLYASRLVKTGVNDFLFSVHGPDAAVHDDHTSIAGSFEKIVQAIKNTKSLGARCRSSMTVTGRNHQQIEATIGLFLELEMECIHLPVFSPVARAAQTDARLYVSYTDAATSIKRAIDRYCSRLPPLSVKYIPFCFMQGYEKYVMNLYQQNHDPDDWNYYYSNKVRRTRGPLTRLAFDAASLAGAAFAKEWSIPRRHGWFGLRVYGFTRLVELLRKKRLPACRHCALDVVCDHVWRDYVSHFGASEFEPVPGRRIKDPAWSYLMACYRKPGTPVGARLSTGE